MKPQQSLLLILPGLGSQTLSHSLTHSNNIQCVCVYLSLESKEIDQEAYSLYPPPFHPAQLHKLCKKNRKKPPPKIHERQKEQYPKKEVEKAHILLALLA